MARDANAITMFRGDSYPLKFILRDKKTKAVLDLTGAVLTLTVDTLSAPPDDTTKVFDVAGVLSATPTDGTVFFTPTPANTATVNDYFYDVQMVQGPTVRTAVKSTFSITQDITK